MVIANSILQALAQADEVPKALSQLRNYFGISDTDLAGYLGMSRQTLANKLKGATPLTARELAGFAAFFCVPIPVLYSGPTETIRWVLDHPDLVSDLRERNFHWSESLAGVA